MNYKEAGKIKQKNKSSERTQRTQTQKAEVSLNLSIINIPYIIYT